jgi:STE24 endopeptidase
MSDPRLPDPAGWEGALKRWSRARRLAIIAWTAAYWYGLANGFMPGGLPWTMYALGVALLWFGAGAYGDLVLGRRYGVVRESGYDWLRRRGKAALYAVLFLAITVGPLPTAMARFPNHWWLPMTVWLAAAWLAWTALIPGVVLPRLIDIRPLPPGSVAQALAELSQQVKRPLPAAVWALAERSTTVQAIVVGIGPTQQILLTDTLLADFTPAEVVAVVAHELSHLERHDLLRRGAVLTLGLGSVLATAARVTTGTAWDLPILGLVTLLVVLTYFRYLRHLELRADRRAVALTGDGAAYGRTLAKIAAANGEPAGAGWLADLWSTHPGLNQRMARLATDR